MDDAELRRIFDGILGRVALLGTASVSAGCDDSIKQAGLMQELDASAEGRSPRDSAPGPQPEPFWPDLPLDEFTALPCDSRALTSGLHPTVAVDYIALRLAQDFAKVIPVDGGSVPAPPDTETESETGVACATAVDAVSCRSALAAIGADVPLGEQCSVPCQHYLVTTAGDTVTRWIGKAEIARFLGTIDTPHEAVLMAHEGTFMGYVVECGSADRGGVRAVADGYEVAATQMVSTCEPWVTDRVLLHVGTDGAVTELRRNVVRVAGGCVGRRARGIASAIDATGTVLGDFFASAAHLEAASVHAFHLLHTALRHHGAPESLLAAASSASTDEVRHGRLMEGLAVRHGGTPAQPVVSDVGVPALFDLAVENAVEGCVRETFGALVGAHQARAARDPEVATVMTEISADEARHAALAWQIAKWLDTRLTAGERYCVRQAELDAVAALRRELDVAVPNEVCEAAGFPDRARATALLDALERALWERPSHPRLCA